MSRPTVTLICLQCNSSYEKDRREHNRQMRKGNINTFCSLSCSATHRNIESDIGNKMKGNLRIGGDYQTDEFSPFRYYMKTAVQRKHECDIDLAYLKELWEQQKGRCAYTGMLLRTRNHKTGRALIDVASLDRIDSSKGYIKGNVQFVSAALNLAKSNLPDETFRFGLKKLFEAYAASKIPSHHTTISNLIYVTAALRTTAATRSGAA